MHVVKNNCQPFHFGEMQVCFVERNIYLCDRTKTLGSFLSDPTQGNIHGLTL